MFVQAGALAVDLGGRIGDVDVMNSTAPVLDDAYLALPAASSLSRSRLHQHVPGVIEFAVQHARAPTRVAAP